MLSQVRPVNKSFCLQMLCEKNYTLLLKLTPLLNPSVINTTIRSKLLETGPFTHTLTLYHHGYEQDLSSPQFKCRVYLDTKSVEVISVQGTVFQRNSARQSAKDMLNKKWGLNYFLEKWLTFQLKLSTVNRDTNHAFNA